MQTKDEKPKLSYIERLKLRELKEVKVVPRNHSAEHTKHGNLVKQS
jgi:hypothetical protein